MKKLVSAFAVCLLAGIVSAQSTVESLNIVGYQTVVASGQYFSSGATFISVGSATGKWRLGDVVAVGVNPETDFIQFLSPATAFTELSATYVDLAAAGGNAGDVGWYTLDLGTRLDDLEFTAGTSFLTSFASSGITLTYSGEVLQGSTTLDLSGQSYPFVANLTPVDLTLGQLTATGFNPETDFIQFLSPATAFTELSATYVDLAAAGGNAGDVGWYTLDLGTRLDSTPFPAGASFLGSFVSTSVTITFPNPVSL